MKTSKQSLEACKKNIWAIIIMEILDIKWIWAIALLSFATACDKDQVMEDENGFSNEPTEIRAYTATQSPGDIWTFDLDHTAMTWTGTWDHGTETDPSDDLAFSGTLSQLPSGFLKLVLDTTTPADAAYPSGGLGFFYAAEIPGMSLFAQPAGSLSGPIINGVDRSDCGTLAGTYNYVRIPPQGVYDVRTQPAYGSLNISETGGEFTFNGIQKSLDCLDPLAPCTTDGPMSIPGSATCDSGTLEINDGTTWVGLGQTTPSGMFMIDFGAGNGGIYGGQQQSITLSEVVGKKLIGFVDQPRTGEQQATSIVFDETGRGLGTLYLDLETNVIDTDSQLEVQINSVNNGLFEGAITNKSGVISWIVGSIRRNGLQLVMAIVTFSDEGPGGVLFPANSAVVGYTP